MPEIATSLILALIIFIPFISTIAIVASRENEKLRNKLVLFCTTIVFLLLIVTMFFFLEGITFKLYLVSIASRIWMHFRIDALGLVFAMVSAALWLLATIYSFGYMKNERSLTRYYAFLLLNLSWTIGIAFAGNLFTLFIFYELLSLSTYPLIVHKKTPETLYAGKKYLIYILTGGAFIFFAIVFTYYLTGSQTLAKTGILSFKYGLQTLSLIFISFIVGFGVKAAIMPFHGWVVDAHPAAPAPASALLSGVMVNAGAFGIMRVVFNIFGVSLVKELGFGIIIAYAASFTIIVSSLLAIEQDNLKRRLAYSTIGQVSYMILGTTLLTPSAVLGGIIHIVNHAFMKGVLFLCAGVIIKQTGKKNISQMKGIGRQFPITMGAFFVAALGMIGTPPLVGFVSKWFLGVGALEAGKPIFIVVLLLSALLGAIYFLPIIYTAFFQKPENESIVQIEKSPLSRELQEVPLSMLIPVMIGTGYIVIFGLFALAPGLPLSLAKMTVKSFLK
ncbi:MAG: monovalent cation/H+ antiporter subunit D family protein [Actinobacteria bacterium]|nr:monovalent cation/H+ antiporter subunit D family protein [Actinomycetota bacterium]